MTSGLRPSTVVIAQSPHGTVVLGASITRCDICGLYESGVMPRVPFASVRSGYRARIMYMTVLSLADARASLSKHIESAATTHERFEITRNGARVAVLLSAEDYDALVETVDILSSPDEVAALRAAIAELESGDVSSADEVRAAMIARGRIAE